jgi:hypothetical protein
MIEALSVAAQVAVGLAGFAGVAVLLGRGPGSWHAVDAVRIRGLLYAAFGALFASLVPVGLLLSGVTEAISVRCGSVATLAVILLWGRTMSRAMGGSDETVRATFNRRVAVVIMTITFVTAAAQIANISGVAGAASPGIFFFGVLLLLGYAAFGFVRLMFVRPSGD